MTTTYDLRDKETFDAMVEITQRFFPKYRVKAKRSMRLHRIIGAILGGLKINTQYMIHYWTYFGGVLAYPEEDSEGARYRSWAIHGHEGTHAAQEARYGLFLWGALYLLGTPLYVLLGLLFSIPFWIVGGLASWLPWWSGFIPVALGVILSSPVPFGYFRGKFEETAYGLSLAVRYWCYGDDAVDDEQVERIVKIFAGPDYFYMNIFKNKVRKRLRKARRLVQDRKFIANWLPRCSRFYSAYYRGLKEQGRTKV